MKKILFLALLLSFFAISCKKNDTNPVTNNSTPDQFFSFDSGKAWVYNEHDSISNEDTAFSRTCTDGLIVLDSTQYHVFLDSNHITNNIDSSFYNLIGNEYFQYTILSPQLPGFKEKYLIGDAPLGTTWTMPYTATIGSGTTSATISANIVNTIEEKGTSLTINSTNYSNLYKVKSEIANATVSLPVVGNLPTTVIQNIHSYYAPKYGLVKSDRKLTISVTISPTLSIILQTLGVTIPAGDIPLTNTNKTTTLTSVNF